MATAVFAKTAIVAQLGLDSVPEERLQAKPNCGGRVFTVYRHLERLPRQGTADKPLFKLFVVQGKAHACLKKGSYQDTVVVSVFSSDTQARVKVDQDAFIARHRQIKRSTAGFLISAIPHP